MSEVRRVRSEERSEEDSRGQQRRMAGRRGGGLRPLDHLPVFIEEDHNEVLPHIYKLIGGKQLPVENNTLVHLDSHPDLLLPKDLTPEEAWAKHQLFAKLSIENWILPGCFVGVFSTVVWVCPPWADQIEVGEHEFYVGVERGTTRLAVSCLQSYYISEGLYVTRDRLDSARKVKLVVVRLEEGSRESREQMLRLQEQIAEVDHYILDIDLDFYSTLNPFVSLYSEAGLYDRLRELYSFCPVPRNLEPALREAAALEANKERVAKVGKLGLLFAFLKREESLVTYTGPGEEYLPQVSAIHEAVRKHCPREEVDWDLIHEAGQTFDDSELPHHVSSTAEIQAMIRQTEGLLNCLAKPPTVVTVARSSLDDYCPPHQVDEIEAGVLGLLHTLYRGVRVTRGYLGAEGDPV